MCAREIGLMGQHFKQWVSPVQRIKWAIVGGTGELARADGTIKHKLIRSTDVESYRQADIHAFYTPAAVKATGTAIQ